MPSQLRASPSTYIKYWPSLAILVFAFCFSIEVSAYIDHISVYKHRGNEKMLMIGGDVHNLGTREENQEQLNLFKSEILDFFEKSGIPLQVLFEDPFTYYINFEEKCRLPSTGEKSFIQLFCPFKEKIRYIKTSLADNPDETTWLINLPELYNKNRENYRHIQIKSIDPRLPSRIWEHFLLAHASFKGLFLTGSDVPQLESFIENNKKEPLSKLLKKLNRSIELDLKQVRKLSRVPSKDQHLLLTGSNEELIQQGIIDEKRLKKIQRLVLSQRFLAASLDKIALWNIAYPDAPSYTFLLAGRKHEENLEPYLKKLGYEKLFATKRPQEFYKQSKENSKLLLINRELPEEIARIFAEIQKKILNLKIKSFSEDPLLQESPYSQHL